jgi:hypothetical protein
VRGRAADPLFNGVAFRRSRRVASHDAAGVCVDPAHARDVIQRLDLDVEPWPFGALV